MAELSVRGQRALETRRRMVGAAYRVFCRDGYAGATMKAIADEADVAVQTLYYTFHTKAGLLGEALGGAIIGFDQWREPPPDVELTDLLPWHGWWDDFASAPTARDALEVFVDNGTAILERVAPLTAALQGAAGDADAANVVELGEERRVQAYREAVDVMAGKPPGLRKGLNRRAATDIVAVLFSPDVHRGLSSDRGWSTARCMRFYSELLATQLLGPTAD